MFAFTKSTAFTILLGAFLACTSACNTGPVLVDATVGPGDFAPIPDKTIPAGNVTVEVFDLTSPGCLEENLLDNLRCACFALQDLQLLNFVTDTMCARLFVSFREPVLSPSPVPSTPNKRGPNNKRPKKKHAKKPNKKSAKKNKKNKKKTSHKKKKKSYGKFASVRQVAPNCPAAMAQTVILLQTGESVPLKDLGVFDFLTTAASQCFRSFPDFSSRLELIANRHGIDGTDMDAEVSAEIAAAVIRQSNDIVLRAVEKCARCLTCLNLGLCSTIDAVTVI